MSEAMHPAWPFVVGAALAVFLSRPARQAVLLAAAALGLALAWALPLGARAETALLGVDLVWLHVDALARPFALIFALIGALGTLYGWSGSRRLHVAGLAAPGAALGIALAGDWVTLYACWEALAICSFVLIADGRAPRAWAAGYRYLLVHLAGGACLLAGVVWHRAAGGAALLGPLPDGAASLLILIAFAVNAAVPPLHAWLTDAYPESSPAGSVLLSAFVTKSAVYALARVFPGLELLVWLGVTMSLYGVVFAILENDIRRLLAYHIVSQVGYMVAGVGMGTPLALAGAVAHAFCHILYKGLLFMGAGAVIRATGRRKLTELGGLAGAMPVTLGLYMVGALSISGAPLLNGFVSKSMVVAAAEADHRVAVALLLSLASVGTFLSVGLKLPVFAFGGRAPAAAPQPDPLPRTMYVAMGLTGALCVLTGVAPTLLYAWLPFPVAYRPYTGEHVIDTLQLLGATGVGFLLLRERLAPSAAMSLDFDRLYRRVGRAVGETLGGRVARAADRLETLAMRAAAPSPRAAARWLTAPVGYAVLIALVALGFGVVLLGAAR